MPDVNFNEEQGFAQRSEGPAQSSMVRLMMKLGFKSEEAANYALIGVAVVCIALAAYIYF